MTRVMSRQEIRGRLRKVQAIENLIDSRLRAEGLNPSDAAAAQRIIDQLSAATPEQWAELAKDAGVNPPSETSQKLLIDLYRTRTKKLESDEELFNELLAQRHEVEG